LIRSWVFNSKGEGTIINLNYSLRSFSSQVIDPSSFALIPIITSDFNLVGSFEVYQVLNFGLNATLYEDVISI